MDFDKLEAQRFAGDGSGADPNATSFAPKDTSAAKEGIHFEEHGLVKAKVEEKVATEMLHPAKISNVTGKAATTATATIKHGTEELLEVLTTPQGQKFVQAMSANVVEGYVQSARTAGFKQATKEAAIAGYTGTLETSEQWLQGACARLMKFLDPQSNTAPVLRLAGIFMAVMAAGSFTLVFSLLLLVWKVLLFGVN